jgi:hypothetical protein
LDHGYVKRYPVPAWGNSSQRLYGAGPAASKVVADSLDLDTCEVLAQIRQQAAPLFLEHTLGLVDLRIAFQQGAHRFGLEDFEWLPEALCRHEYSVRKPGGSWQKQVLKPDAFTRWKAEGRTASFFLELDLGHVSLGAFKKKVESYRQYLNLGVFAEGYRTDRFDVLLVTTGRRRLSHLQGAVGESVAPKFFFAVLADIRQDGPYGSAWRDGQIASLLLGDRL